MARRSRSTGVGRGNGPGSTSTQFKAGMPSGNPNGRPKRVKLPPASSLAEAVTRKLSETVSVSDGIREKKMQRSEAMVAILMDGYARGSTSERLRILDWCLTFAPQLAVHIPKGPDPDAIRKLVDTLAEEYYEDKAKEQQLLDSGTNKGPTN